MLDYSTPIPTGDHEDTPAPATIVPAAEPGAASNSTNSPIGYAAADTPDKLGAHAAHYGGDIQEDNPFDSGTAEHTDWRRGFAAEQHRRDEQARAFTPRLLTTDDNFRDLRPQNGTDFRLAELYAALDCDRVEVVYLGTSGLILIIDEEGALSDARAERARHSSLVAL